MYIVIDFLEFGFTFRQSDSCIILLSSLVLLLLLLIPLILASNREKHFKAIKSYLQSHISFFKHVNVL